MSNKKWRKPAEGAEAPSDADRHRQEEATNKLYQIARDYHDVFHTAFKPRPREHDLTDGDVTHMLTDFADVLWQIVSMTGAVLSTVDVQQVRNIVGPELKLPHVLQTCISKTDWKEADFLHNAPEPMEDEKAVKATPPAKRPRGAKHPLVGLLEIAISAVRLFEKITRGTNPNAHNKRTLKQQDNAEWLKEMSAPFPT